MGGGEGVLGGKSGKRKIVKYLPHEYFSFVFIIVFF